MSLKALWTERTWLNSLMKKIFKSMRELNLSELITVMTQTLITWFWKLNFKMRIWICNPSKKESLSKKYNTWGIEKPKRRKWSESEKIYRDIIWGTWWGLTNRCQISGDPAVLILTTPQAAMIWQCTPQQLIQGKQELWMSTSFPIWLDIKLWQS